MAYDREVLRMIWEGQIALSFQADPDEIVGLQQPENFYLMASRLSYLPLVTDKVFSIHVKNTLYCLKIAFFASGSKILQSIYNCGST